DGSVLTGIPFAFAGAPGWGGAQGEIPVPPAPVAPHQQIKNIRDAVTALAVAGTLNTGQAHSLTLKLDNATNSMRMAQVDSAVQWMQLFRQEVSGLANGNIIPSSIASQVAFSAITAENAIRTLAAGFPRPEPDPKNCRPGFGACQITPCSA